MRRAWIETTLRVLLLALLAAPAIAQVGEGPRDAECGEGVMDEFPDRYWTCEALQSFSKGFDEHAFDLFKRASQWGSKEAQYRVGLMLLGGIGTEVDLVEGAAWLLLANERNNREITARLAEVLEVLDASDRRAAEARAAGLREEYGDLAALERRTRWVRWAKRDMTGSRIGAPIGSNLVMVSGDALAPGSPRPTGRRAGGGLGTGMVSALDAYELQLRNIVTSVEYRDFEVIEPGGADEGETEDGAGEER